MLKGVSEAEGIEGWQQAKITKAADYMSSVFHSLDYDMKFGDGGQMANQMSMSTETKNYKETLQSKLAEKTTKDRYLAKKESVESVCPDCGNPSWKLFLETEAQKGVDGKRCWKGYKRMGTKKKGGKTVDNCVKM